MLSCGRESKPNGKPFQSQPNIYMFHLAQRAEAHTVAVLSPPIIKAISNNPHHVQLFRANSKMPSMPSNVPQTPQDHSPEKQVMERN